jgi:chromosome segregation ATPase
MSNALQPETIEQMVATLEAFRPHAQILDGIEAEIERVKAELVGIEGQMVYAKMIYDNHPVHQAEARHNELVAWVKQLEKEIDDKTQEVRNLDQQLAARHTARNALDADMAAVRNKFGIG